MPSCSPEASLLIPLSASSVSGRKTVGRGDRSETGTHAGTLAPEKHVPDNIVICVNIPCAGNVWVTSPKTASLENGKQVTRLVAAVTPLARQTLLRLARVSDVELIPIRDRGSQMWRIRPSHLGAQSQQCIGNYAVIGRESASCHHPIPYLILYQLRIVSFEIDSDSVKPVISRSPFPASPREVD